MIKARMRNGVSWHDVCVLNLSRRGLGIQAAEPPPSGTYVEICRGHHVIVARVMWARGQRAGLYSQDAIAVLAIVRDTSANDFVSASAYPIVDRRRTRPVSKSIQENSRLAARAMEFACAGLIATTFGLAVFSAVEHALARPIAQARAALDR